VRRLLFRNHIQIWKIPFLVLIPCLREDSWRFRRTEVFIWKIELQMLLQFHNVVWLRTHSTSVHEEFVAVDTSLSGFSLKLSGRLPTCSNSRLTLMILLSLLNAHLPRLIRSELLIWIYICVWVDIAGGKDRFTTIKLLFDLPCPKVFSRLRPRLLIIYGADFSKLYHISITNRASIT